jgi:ACS family hexuronate transporter-like MFS transporter
VCGLLLLATMINYMDRLTLNLTASQIKEELHLDNEQYGNIEAAFSIAFAVGALGMGWLADRWNVRWIYPLALLGWSAAGFTTGFAWDFASLMCIRFALGLFESGNWPCALRTTQHILRPGERTLGNSILQSGAAVGAIIIPLVVWLVVVGPGTWPRPFFVVGAAGMVWVLVWLVSVRGADLDRPDGKWPGPDPVSRRDGLHVALLPVLRDRRFWALVIVTISINQTWHFFRSWLPLCLREHYQYGDAAVYPFTTAYYVATDLGSLAAGFGTLWLARRGMGVHGSRLLVYLACSLLTALSVVAALLPAGPLLLGVLLVIGFGALGLYPAYYSFSQDLTVRHQGKLTGMLSFSTWVATAVMQHYVGLWLKRMGDWTTAMALAGLMPLLGLLALVLIWRPISRGAAEAVPAVQGSAEATGAYGAGAAGSA